MKQLILLTGKESRYYKRISKRERECIKARRRMQVLQEWYRQVYTEGKGEKVLTVCKTRI